jgi:D-amino peptidase
MKIYISVDMEGIPGTFNWEHEKIDRASVRKCMMDHVEIAIDEILSSPAAKKIREITIADSHSNGDNLFYQISSRDERISLISGSPRPEYMMPAFDGSYDMVFLLGYHAGTGALHANMDHTYSNSKIQKIMINGIAMSEALINAAYAGYHGVPVALVSGDIALQKELMPFMPWLQFVTTKEAVSKFAAKNYSSMKVEKDLRRAVQAALLSKDLQLYCFEPKAITLQIEFHSTSMADVVCLMPSVKRLDGKTIQFIHDDYGVMFNALMALITLAYATGI